MWVEDKHKTDTSISPVAGSPWYVCMLYIVCLANIFYHLTKVVAINYLIWVKQLQQNQSAPPLEKQNTF